MISAAFLIKIFILQVIISVSQMLGNVIGLNNARFQESLSLINSYASSDKVMKGTGIYNKFFTIHFVYQYISKYFTQSVISNYEH